MTRKLGTGGQLVGEQRRLRVAQVDTHLAHDRHHFRVHVIGGLGAGGERASTTVPSLILADEPTASLDGALGRQVMDLFAKVAHERHAGVLVVSHDTRTLELFDRILDIEDGAISSRTNQKEPRPKSTA